MERTRIGLAWTFGAVTVALLLFDCYDAAVLGNRYEVPSGWFTILVPLTLGLVGPEIAKMFKRNGNGNGKGNGEGKG